MMIVKSKNLSNRNSVTHSFYLEEKLLKKTNWKYNLPVALTAAVLVSLFAILDIHFSQQVYLDALLRGLVVGGICLIEGLLINHFFGKDDFSS